MRSIVRRMLPVLVLLLLLTPVAVFAQSETAAQLVELVFSDDESSVQIEETIQSVARVTFTHDGQDYVMKVPVTIEIDETVEIADSVSSTDTAARVGSYAVEIVGISEQDEPFVVNYSSVEPSQDGHKLILVGIRLKNLSDETRDFGNWNSEEVIAVDDLGRRFESVRTFGCGEVNPGGAVDCIVVYDVAANVTLVRVDIYAMDKRTMPLPELDEEDEEEDDS